MDIGLLHLHLVLQPAFNSFLLFWCHPSIWWIFCLSSRGRFSRSCLVQRPSLYLPKYTAHLYFRLAILLTILLQIWCSEFCFLMTIQASIAVCIVFSFIQVLLVNVKVSAAYVITGNKHRSNIFRLRHIGGNCLGFGCSLPNTDQRRHIQR